MSAPKSLVSPVSRSSPATRTMMRSASPESPMPPRLHSTTAPESWATIASSPVPTIGASLRSRGTAWRCMFEPMRARLASSFSRKGMRAAGAGADALADQVALLVDARVGLGDDVLLLFPGRQVEGLGLGLDLPLLRLLQPGVLLGQLVAGHHLAEAERPVPDLEH